MIIDGGRRQGLSTFKVSKLYDLLVSLCRWFTGACMFSLVFGHLSAACVAEISKGVITQFYLWILRMLSAFRRGEARIRADHTQEIERE